MLNESKGNMYPFVSHTWNTIKGKCPHGCAYCYMKRWGEQPELHFDEKSLKDDLGKDNFIFFGSSCDVFADRIPQEWLLKSFKKIHEHRLRNEDTLFLFQTKNPTRLDKEWVWALPNDSIVGTTIESNRFCRPPCGGVD